MAQLSTCMCEGSAELAILKILLEHDRLIFNSESLVDGKPIRRISVSKFQEEYLQRSYGEDKITLFRILDSKSENFNLKPVYKKKVHEIFNILTCPEIEILIIICEGHYEKFKKNFAGGKRKISASQYCMEHLKFKDVKRYGFVKEYFSDPDKLEHAIKEYASSYNAPPNQKGLNDILKK